MSEKVSITISPAVAVYVRPGTPLEARLAGCAEAEKMATADRLTLLFCLSKDADPAVRSAALSCLESLQVEPIKEYAESTNPNPLILDLVKKLCHNYPDSQQAPVCLIINEEESETPLEESDHPPESIEQEPLNEEDDRYLSKYKTVQLMDVGEKIKMALSGDKEWRSILVKDPNKLVSGSVIKNPRITEAEILNLIKSGIQNDEIMRLICANKEWIKNYNIRKALIENSRTPLQNASRYLATMNDKDLASFAKSKNISSVISTMARRLVLNKKRD